MQKKQILRKINDKYYTIYCGVMLINNNIDTITSKYAMENLFNAFVNLLLPIRCVSCGVIVDGNGGICPACFAKIHFISAPYCSLCGMPFEYAEQGFETSENALICGRCIENPPFYSKAMSAIKYNENSRSLLLSFKYFDRTDLAETFSKWMISAGEDVIKKSDIIIPVPMHKTRMLIRKYNQAALLANKISIKTNIPTVHNILVRNKKTAPQKQGREKRALNVKGAFKVLNPDIITDKSVLLIDDVITSGATINECATTLKKNGAKDVFALSLARA